MSLPTKDQYEELKEKKKQELERKLQMERLVKYESQRRQEEKLADYTSRSLATSNGEVHRSKRVAMKKTEGWLPTASISRNQELTDPLLQQIDNITSFIKQAKAANRLDEVQMLQENLRQLQDEYDQQQTVKAIELSKQQAEMEEMQREQLQILCEKEWKRDHKKKMSQHSRTRSLDFREVKPDKLEMERESINQIAEALDLDKLQDKDCTGSKAAFPSDGVGLPGSKNLILVCQPAKASEHEKASINPSLISPPESNPDSPVAENTAVASLPTNALHSYEREYNPFDEEEEQEQEDSQQANGVDLCAPNPFEDSVGNPFYTPVGNQESGNPFEESVSSALNPFEVESDNEVSGEDIIEEELLLQQIDNIKAYIFDAKQSGRMDEIEVLTENLKELKSTLAKQKKKSSC
uniref:Rabenosyn, RAB effector n=1 Tax=Naja naja TaxID=35670 RepID=A0A8C6YFW0_NAJNA